MSFTTSVFFGVFEAFLLIGAMLLIKLRKKFFAVLLIIAKLALYIKAIVSLVKEELFSELYAICGCLAGFFAFLVCAWAAYFIFLQARKIFNKPKR